MLSIRFAPASYPDTFKWRVFPAQCNASKNLFSDTLFEKVNNTAIICFAVCASRCAKGSQIFEPSSKTSVFGSTHLKSLPGTSRAVLRLPVSKSFYRLKDSLVDPVVDRVKGILNDIVTRRACAVAPQSVNSICLTNTMTPFSLCTML
jgi:hypothetical protein